jgi:hypothetical protein
MKITNQNEAVLFDSLRKFYIEQIKKAGSFYSTSKLLGKSHNYVHEIVSKPKSIEKIRSVYYAIKEKKRDGISA